MVKKAKAHLELNLARNRKGNKKGFYRFIISIRNIGEKVGLLLNVSRGIVNKDMERPVRYSVLSHVPEISGEVGSKKDPQWRGIRLENI